MTESDGTCDGASLGTSEGMELTDGISLGAVLVLGMCEILGAELGVSDGCSEGAAEIVGTELGVILKDGI